jgi:hypothetical protein
MPGFALLDLLEGIEVFSFVDLEDGLDDGLAVLLFFIEMRVGTSVVIDGISVCFLISGKGGMVGHIVAIVGSGRAVGDWLALGNCKTH